MWEMKRERFFFFLNHANKVNDLQLTTIKTQRIVYKRRAEETVSSRVTNVCFVVLFLIVQRDGGGINVKWLQGGRPVYRLHFHCYYCRGNKSLQPLRSDL